MVINRLITGNRPGQKRTKSRDATKSGAEDPRQTLEENKP
jgi:hypothetical protein